MGNCLALSMAKFEISHAITDHNEGGYANNKADHGGETYAGIARNFWPKWEGWKLIDGAKIQGWSANSINNAMLYNPTMQAAISNFYKQNFWQPLNLDLINDQQIANNVYDCGVNSGTGYAAKVLQRAAGVNADGVIGSGTIKAVNSDSPKEIYDSINNQRIAKYNQLAQTPSQHQFLKSWLSRIRPYKTV